MLRISSHDDVDGQTLVMEGRLAGVWVSAAEQHWTRVTAVTAARPIAVDLRSVLGVDAAGRRLLARMHDEGAEFIVAGCAMRALVNELTDAAAGDRRDLVERE